MIIVELFAGVGGFRLGLEGYKPKNKKEFYSLQNGFKKGFTKSLINHQDLFITGFANQFEPSTPSKQHAAEVYKERFPDGTMETADINNIDGVQVLDKIKKTVPKNRFKEDLILVGGFPCQDYSVAQGLHKSKGIQGKKGVLWWSIFQLLQDLKDLNKQPKFLLLENVDRLIKSPRDARGKDFTILLHCLYFLGYDVEYQVINAAEYGFPQRRRRVFIFANLREGQSKKAVLKKAFPFSILHSSDPLRLFEELKSRKDLDEQLLDYNQGWDYLRSPYQNYGTIKDGVLETHKVLPTPGNIKKTTFADIIQRKKTDGEIPSGFFLADSDIPKWEKAKGKASIERIGLNRDTGQRDFEYKFSIGKMATFESLDKPLRTIITSEGGKAALRTKHIVDVTKSRGGKYETGKRRLTPLELERANCFPDFFTLNEDISDTKRAFLMGNALVIGVVERIRNAIIENYDL